MIWGEYRMDETMKNMLLRHTCRCYRAEQIREAHLEQVLQSGCGANNGQEGEPVILVCQKPVLIRELSERSEDSQGFYGVPAIIALLTKKEGNCRFHDCLVIAEQMAAAAARVGLGSCYISGAERLFDSEPGKRIKKQAGLRVDFKARICMCLGYPEEGEEQGILVNGGRIYRI